MLSRELYAFPKVTAENCMGCDITTVVFLHNLLKYFKMKSGDYVSR